MSLRLAVAVSVSGALHLAVAAALIGLPGRSLEEPAERGVGITVVFSPGGGGERIGEPGPVTPPADGTADDAPASAGDPAGEPAPAPPVPTAALPLPLPPAPPTAPRGPAIAAEPRAQTSPRSAPASAAAPAPSSGLLVAAVPAAVGRKVDPVVPEEARRNRWQGTVVLAVTVSPEGVPEAVEMLRSTGHALLDRAAIEAMWQWRFDPARRGGVPVAERIAIPITFRIVD